MRTIRLTLLLVALSAATPLLGSCINCAYLRDCYVCETTYYDGYLSCTLINNGGACMLVEPCEGPLGEKCTAGNPASCEEYRVELREPRRERETEWRLVSVEVDGRRVNPRS